MRRAYRRDRGGGSGGNFTVTPLGRLLTVSFVLLNVACRANAEILTPPYFNLAEGRKIYASATCGEDTEGPELYCKLVGPTTAENDVDVNVIQGQHCDVCDPTRPDKRHPPEYAVDGMETWWQSPPLSRGMKYQEINLTIDLGQEFHVAYVYVRMGNSPRPGLWVLEKSVDYGQNFMPWQYFSDSPGDCAAHFGAESLRPITRDDSVICNTEHSRIVPLEGGEIPISLLNNRPSASHYFNSSVLQEWTRATNVRLRLLRTKNLFGHLMSVARQDPTVTRRYFYSIKDISIGGRCMCNGHADTCDNRDPTDPAILVCLCRHNTCGPKCNTCCPGFEQKAWRQSKSSAPFKCEPCNCFSHSNKCIYDPEIDSKGLSLDIQGNYAGGGVCQNCQHNTEGINCNKCKPKYYKPFRKHWNETDACQPCDCDKFYSTGKCEEGTGRCECRIEYKAPNCDSCSFGYYGHPNCRECDCNLNGTIDLQCEAVDGKCHCEKNFGGDDCRSCADDYHNFPSCEPCECNPLGALSSVCEKTTGNCSCKSSFGGKQCDQCQNGYYNYPSCLYCKCDVKGTEDSICNKESGECLCREGYGGERCDRCIPGYYGYPECKPCNCTATGSSSKVCDATGKCSCLSNFAGRICELCSPGYYMYPECLSCNCDSHGSIGVSCHDGVCQCERNFDGEQCDRCKEGFYNFPSCEDCNCNPAGVIAAFAGCGSVPKGELCQCKERVEGRICDKCKPLYWNLNTHNPDGCEECNCNPAGVLGGISVCNNEHGQCTCKPSVVARGCSECEDGTFNLQADNLFGCTDCGCDVGGSVGPVCDKRSGQCQCQPRVTGRTCKEPLQTHYFSTLYHFQFEVEDGRTEDSTVRYYYNETEFPDYSWKGYAIFYNLQQEIIMDIDIYKPSVYRMIFRYVNRNTDSVPVTIKVIPDNPNDNEQKHQVLFKSSVAPAFATVKTGNVPVALVMNPGRWMVSITAERNLLLDYFVLLPEEFYTASILNQKVEGPCTIGYRGLCREFSYPDILGYDVSLGAGGYIDVGSGGIATLTEYYENEAHLSELGIKNKIPLLNGAQPEIDFNITLSKPGPYVIVINYITPHEDQATHTVDVGVINNNDIKYYTYDQITLYNCNYTTVCRQVVVNEAGVVSVYSADENLIHIKLKGEDLNVGIQSIVAIPYEQWSLDFIQPRPICIRKDNKCIASTFPNPPESKKILFSKEAIVHEGHEKTVTKIENATYVRLNQTDNMLDLRSKVTAPGLYSFVLHYYQPEYPEYDIDVLIQNGVFYESKVPVRHCPSKSGCRALVTQNDGSTKFPLTENFMMSFTLPENKNVYLRYLLVIPHDLYSQQILEEESLDRTGEFISTCGANDFYIDTKEEGFCRDSVFSITTGYNNGALPCQCDYIGSLSFNCEQFGGQCQCKPDVIGRTCSICRPGYFGFPDCKPCNCPSTSKCDDATGQCICPRNVVGERCDQCAPLTYGFDPYSGCEECKCSALGVETTLQCDLSNGTCPCKENVVGRKCDTCLAGHFAFPYCEPCECEYRGTTEEICDQQSAECFCKKFVRGPACDVCTDGTFDLQDNKEAGCTECFCFGKTTRCYSSILYKTGLIDMAGWHVAVWNDTFMNLTRLNDTLPRVGHYGIGVDFNKLRLNNATVYFGAPARYLGKHLTSYGGYLNYTIFYTLGEYGKATMKPDIILEGSTLMLIHNSFEQPAPALDYVGTLEIVEGNFVLANGMPAKREHLMTVLKDLRGLYVRATYWSVSHTSRLSNVVLDSAVETINGTGFYDFASSVEHCECPPNYQGLSCEECAPGYYRVATGPHGGYCAPCQCNGHADECDVNTGVCLNCDHNTIGDHCEQCSIGYHGNALQGTPIDCLICACPLPIASNNFATGCEVSADGEKRSCTCNEEYFGEVCQSCAPGFYGKPEVIGDYCKPCQCSGNINSEDPGSCDTVSGQCLKCLNNTYGTACALCAPGHFGDAIERKDCQVCDCDELGTERCNSYTGECVCRENVIGEKCDRCQVDHYGFSAGQGCVPCECGSAASSTQCDDTTGQCRCKPGASGRMCDRCASGFWDYTSEGCNSCGCKSEYSLGFGCNALTGQCECLPGVTGDKCDKCPHRWAFVPDHGCIGCDSCIDNLLDYTDELASLIDPVQSEYDAVDSGYFTTRRLSHINDTVRQLQPKVLQLRPELSDLDNFFRELDTMEQDSNNMNRKANYSLENNKMHVTNANGVREVTLEVADRVDDAGLNVQNTIDQISQISTALTDGQEPAIETALAQAKNILEAMKVYSLTERQIEADKQSIQVDDLLTELDNFKEPVDTVAQVFKMLKTDLRGLNEKLNDLANETAHALEKTHLAKELYDKNGKDRLQKKLESINQQTKEIEGNLYDSQRLITNASELLLSAQGAYSDLSEDLVATNQLIERFNNTLEEHSDNLLSFSELRHKLQSHARDLSIRAQEFDNLLTETRSISENAVKAATAYNDIINAITDAEGAAQDSKEEVDVTAELLDQISAQTQEAIDKSEMLLLDVTEARDNITNLQPQVEDAARKSRPVRALHNENEEQLKLIEKYLETYHTKPHDDSLMEAKENAEDAQEYSQKTLKEVENGFKKIEDLTDKSKKLPKQVYNANQDVGEVKRQLEMVNEKLPELQKAVSELPFTLKRGDGLGDSIEEKIKKLNQQIALARDIANRIDVGLKFNRATQVELKNPNNLADMTTSTRISGYFRTSELNGLLLYVGNGNGTNLHRTKTDDYMALEILNGYPTLTLDLGNDAERIVNKKFVSDNEWYQFIIDRTGLNAKLTIRQQLADGRENDTVTEQQLEGPYSIFNLDKNRSKIFVGSYPLDFKVQDKLEQNSFEGEMEGLVIGETPVSLWNFNSGYENKQGATQRDKLRKRSTGYRFNGQGYAILNARSFAMKRKSDVQLSFKTFSPDGLLFLYGDQKTFIALELKNGKVNYKYNLGSGTKLYRSPKTYNDGQWHRVEAARDGNQGRLKIDNVQIDEQSADIVGNVIDMQETFFFGGYPQTHSVSEVTNVDFDGCIDNVVIMGNPVDLSTNIKAYGVSPGCPEKITRLISFYGKEGNGGKDGEYIKKEQVGSSNDFKINLKFKTTEKNGLIFYLADRSQEHGISVSLQNGYLKLISQKIELVSNEYNFNDNEWHVISIRHNSNVLKMDYDDYAYKVTDSAPPLLHILYGDLYIGGLPGNFKPKKGMIAMPYVPFSGCIGDATINGTIINFADLANNRNVVLGRCILEKEIGSDTDIHTVPLLPPVESLDRYTTREPEIRAELPEESEYPKRGDGGHDTGESETEDDLLEVEVTVPPTTTTTFKTTTAERIATTEAPKFETTWPTPRVHQETTTTTPKPGCALPLTPAVDPSILASGSYRFGTERESRLEYKTPRGKHKKQFDFSLWFRTGATEGILFYVADALHSAFVGLYLKDGYLHYKFSGGSGPPLELTSTRIFSDDLWHHVVMSRDGAFGKLVVDDELESEHKAERGIPKIELSPPYYIGGIAPHTYNMVLVNLNETSSYKGCIRDFLMNDKPMENPEEVRVVPCSDHVEPGMYFGGTGLVKLKEKFKVGLELDARMDIKPRSNTGFIMAVHGRRDYFVLELDNGALKLTVENGKGAISTTYIPTSPYFFCDGHWHSIQAVKSKSVVTLAVNGVYSDPGIGDHRSPSTDTGGFLFLGSHRFLMKAKGISSRIPYRGCIRNVQINNNPIAVTTLMTEGNVTIGSCPTN